MRAYVWKRDYMPPKTLLAPPESTGISGMWDLPSSRLHVLRHCEDTGQRPLICGSCSCSTCPPGVIVVMFLESCVQDVGLCYGRFWTLGSVLWPQVCLKSRAVASIFWGLLPIGRCNLLSIHCAWAFPPGGTRAR